MTVSEYMVEHLIRYGVTDAFGIPGGVVLRLLYAMKDRMPEIVPHINYHEQTAGFAACGYAQAGNRLGVAYATRGPGILNMVTCIAEAWQESVSVLFLTAHANRMSGSMRFHDNQEMDLLNVVSGFTKYAANVEDVEDVASALDIACNMALDGRKGPVFLDFSSALLGMQMDDVMSVATKKEKENQDIHQEEKAICDLKTYLTQAERPVILIGDGIRQAVSQEDHKVCLEKLGIPIVSSRGSQDIFSASEFYFGYIGSHGCRYSNFIFSKADVVIAIGNRMAFPDQSHSFVPIFDRIKLLRFDIDAREFQRKIPGEKTYHMDADQLMTCLKDTEIGFEDMKGWLHVCRKLKEKLNLCDVGEPVERLAYVLQVAEDAAVYVCDVGNNEYWFSRAYELVRPQGSILCSKSFGTLGTALSRAIGAYYATRKKIVCVTGDQGFQYHIQELMYIGQWKLPIKIVLVNNHCSGMIRDQEEKQYGAAFMHVTKENGYSVPDFKAVAKAYEIRHIYDQESDKNAKAYLTDEQPLIYEIVVHPQISLEPKLPKGSPMQRMEPFLSEADYRVLDHM